jgi:urease accessory protein
MKRAACAVAALLLWSDAAQAHMVIPGIGGFAGGALHPILVLSHALALIALGLLAGVQPPRARLILIAIFPAAMIFAFGFVALAYATDRAELAVLTLTAVTGLTLAAHPQAPFAIAAILVALGSGAILFDSVPAVPSVRETVLALAGTAFSATAVVAIAAFAGAALPAFWPRIGVRVAGSWIAASAILVLALRLAKL